VISLVKSHVLRRARKSRLLTWVIWKR